MDFPNNVSGLIIKEEQLKSLLKIAKDNMEAIDAKYYETAPVYSIKVQSTPKTKDEKIIQAMYEKYEKTYTNYDGKDYTLDEYIKRLEEEILDTKNTINVYKEAAGKLTGIENELYFCIRFNGMKPTKAVKHIAKKYDMLENNIWRRQYRNIKKYLK